ncbi:MAG: methionine--tRNA ligase [Candidatus Micrarchaeota archaeon]
MKFFVSTPLYYTNASLHLGHAYTTIAADVIARYKRMRGFEVFFLTGTDEHGSKVEKAAVAAGKRPKEFVDELIPEIKRLWERLGISYDHFVRTTDDYHERQVQEVLQKLYDKGDIYKGTYEGWYCLPCESFWTDLQLAEGKCPDCGREVQKSKEETYFFKMSKYRQKLLELFEENKGFVQPEFRRAEVLNFFKDELKDLSISRATLKWGIPLPFDSSHVAYVWFDALFNYWTALAHDGNKKRQATFWPADLHLVGKEILRFHAVYWPAMLFAAGLPASSSVYAHGWWTVEGEKMSKSRGNVVDPDEVIDKYGADAFRYFLLREVPFGMDGDFSEKALVQRINNDLASEYGNLLNRTLVMVERYSKALIPQAGPKAEKEAALAAAAGKCVAFYAQKMDSYEFHHALEGIWEFVKEANKYVNDCEPWNLAKNNDARLNTVLACLAESLRLATVLLAPFIPFKADEAWKQLGYSGKASEQRFEAAKWGLFKPGTRTARAGVLFQQVK